MYELITNLSDPSSQVSQVRVHTTSIIIFIIACVVVVKWVLPMIGAGLQKGLTKTLEQQLETQKLIVTANKEHSELMAEFLRHISISAQHNHLKGKDDEKV